MILIKIYLQFTYYILQFTLDSSTRSSVHIFQKGSQSNTKIQTSIITRQSRPQDPWNEPLTPVLVFFFEEATSTHITMAIICSNNYITFYYSHRIAEQWCLHKPNIVHKQGRFINLSYDGGRGGALCAHDLLFIFLLKISPPDQTLRPTCEFLILGTFYLAFFFLKI